MYRLFFIAVCFFVLESCGNNNEETARKDGFTPVLKTKEDSLFHEVMEGHNIGMAKTGQIKNYSERVKQALDSINQLPVEKLDILYQQALMDLQEDLNYANYSMNTWMDEFNADSVKDNEEKRIQYLEAEKTKVLKVKEAILGSLQRADSLFNK